jgi:hypothetical protein
VLGTLTICAGLLTAQQAPAHAAGPRPLFQLPVTCGQTWRLQQYIGHDDYDIDMYNHSGETNNAPVLASYGGTVVSAGYDSGGGNHVRIDHGSGWQTRYLHMIRPANVSVGQTVRQGQQIGNVGSTGNSGAPHLHFEQLRDGAKVESYFNGVASGITHDNANYSVTRTSANCSDQRAGIYGVLADGAVTYTLVETATGDFVSTVNSGTAKLPFVPKALAALNFNTLLVTSPAGELFRVDIRTNKTSVTFDAPLRVKTGGWTHELLAYDGAGSLFGYVNGKLHRYSVSGAKPTNGSITNYTVVDGSFNFKTLTATGPGWVLGTTDTGDLKSYKITGTAWSGGTIKAAWHHTHVLSPGGGYYYGRMPAGSLYHYQDRNPYDFNGSDLVYNSDDPVNDRGWTQVLLSAQPL